VCRGGEITGHRDRIELRGHLLKTFRSPGGHHNIGTCYRSASPQDRI
jgi:hypothetical protein